MRDMGVRILRPVFKVELAVIHWLKQQLSATETRILMHRLRYTDKERQEQLTNFYKILESNHEHQAVHAEEPDTGASR